MEEERKEAARKREEVARNETKQKEAEASRKEEEVAKSAPELQLSASLAQDLSEVLSAAKLSHYEDALRELGCAVPEDLRVLDDADLMEIGMKKVEIKRLQRLYSSVP
jgi:hypothetical protein